jgi:hypothetical protein
MIKQTTASAHKLIANDNEVRQGNSDSFKKATAFRP